MNQHQKSVKIQVEFHFKEHDLQQNLRLTRIDTRHQMRTGLKFLFDYDFTKTPQENIDAQLRKIEFKGNTKYSLCLERTLQNKVWDFSKKDLLVDLFSFKEDDIQNYVIERELYHLVPCDMLDPRPSAAAENRVYPEHKIGELHCIKSNNMLKNEEIEKLW